MNINIPPDSEQWLFSDDTRDDSDVALWSFRYPPPCEVGDPLYFRFDGAIVARATVLEIRPPGELDGPSHHGRRNLTGHKVIWLWASFEDLRQRPDVVESIETALKQRRKARMHTNGKSNQARRPPAQTRDAVEGRSGWTQ